MRIGGNLAWKDGREISDTAEYVFEFPKGWLLTFSSRLGSGPEEDFEVFYGKERKLDSRNWISRTAAHRRPADATDATLAMPPDEGTRHVGNWLDCMRSRQAPNAPIQAGFAHAVACCLGREAERTGRRVRYDAAHTADRARRRTRAPGARMRKIDLTNFRLATSETARQINRRIALNFIRLHQPMSRADLARKSGLQRSTVSAIVDQLIEEGWVTEGAVGRSPRGRRPRNLHLNVERAGILGVELRPETTTIGLAGVDARFMAQATFADGHRRRTVRGGSRRRHGRACRRPPAGAVRRHGRQPARARRRQRPAGVRAEPRLGPVQIAQMIEAAVGLPVNVENAANACALAELWFGRHPEHIRHIVAVTVSEGIGVGLLLNGQLVHGAGSMAGEFGHVSLDEDWPALPLRAPRVLGTLRVELGGRPSLSGAARSGASVSGAPTVDALRGSGPRWPTAATRRPSPRSSGWGVPGHRPGESGDGPGARRHRRRRRSHRHLGSHRPDRRRPDAARARFPTAPRAWWRPTPRRSRASAAR